MDDCWLVEQPDIPLKTNKATISVLETFQPILTCALWLSYFNSCHFVLPMKYLSSVRKNSFSRVADSAYYILPFRSSIQHIHFYGIVVPTLTESNVAALKAPVLCEVTAIPASTDPLVLNVTLDPATCVQLTPSLDVYAV